MMVSSLWSLNALRWRKALSLFGPRITRPSLTPHAWPLSMNGESKYHMCSQILMPLPGTWMTLFWFFFPHFLSPCVLVSRSRAIFNSISLEDLCTFSCVVTNTDGISSSYTLTEEGESAHNFGISAPVRLKLSFFIHLEFVWWRKVGEGLLSVMLFQQLHQINLCYTLGCLCVCVEGYLILCLSNRAVVTSKAVRDM